MRRMFDGLPAYKLATEMSAFHMQLDSIAPVFCLGIGLHGFILKWKFGKRSATGRRQGPCGQVAPDCGYVVKGFFALSTYPWAGVTCP